MFSFHKPRVYRSTEGCCICRAKSSSSRFTDSKKYEDDSMKCFNLEKPRQGEICNACVLLVKRFKRLPAGSNRHWGHVVDARIGPGMKSMTKFKKLREEQNAIDKKQNETKTTTSIPKKIAQMFKKNKKKNLQSKENKRDGNWEDQSLPPTPESLDSDGEDLKYLGNYKSRGKLSRLRNNRRKARHPIKYRNKIDNISFVDETIWKRSKSCCGIIYEHTKMNAIIVDALNYKPCIEHENELKIDKSAIVNAVIETDINHSSKIQDNQTNLAAPLTALKKHHLYFKRQSENFPRGDVCLSKLNIKTDLNTIAAVVKSQINENSPNLTIKQQNKGFLHKIKADTGKIVKHSIEKLNTLRIKHTDLSEMKNLIKTVDKQFIIKTQNENKISVVNKNVAEQSVATKFSDNSSDSGFDENLQDRKSASPSQEDHDKKIMTRPPPIQSLFLTSGVQIHGQHQNLILTGNEVAAKILQTRKQPQKLQISNTTKLAQNKIGSQKVRAIYNTTTEGLISVTTTPTTTSATATSKGVNPPTTNNNNNNNNNNSMLNGISTSTASLNQKIILVKTKYNHNQQQQQQSSSNNNNNN